MKSKKNFIMLAVLSAFVLALNHSGYSFAEASGSIEGADKVENFIRAIVNTIIGMSGIVAAGALAVGGFKYITSTGNPDELEKAKSTIKYAIIGLIIVIAAFFIANSVGGSAHGFFG